MDSKQEVLDQVGVDLYKVIQLYVRIVVLILAIVGITWPFVCLCVLGSHCVVCSYDFSLVWQMFVFFFSGQPGIFRVVAAVACCTHF